MTKLAGSKWACGVFLLCAATAIVALAQVFTKIADFDQFNGATPPSQQLQEKFRPALWTDKHAMRKSGAYECPLR